MRSLDLSVFDVVRQAWLERRVADQFSGGGQLSSDYGGRWPGWFKFFELGFGHGEAPSILFTMDRLDADNRKRAAMMAAKLTKQRRGR